MEPVEFVGSRGRSTLPVRITMWAVAGVAVVAALLRSGFSATAMVSSVPVLILIGLVDFAVRRQLRVGRRIVLLDADGIESPLFTTRAKRFGWNEIAGVTAVTVQGGRMLELQLQPAPARRDKPSIWNGVNAGRPRMPLAALQEGEQEAVLQLALERAGLAVGPDGAPAINPLREERLFRERLVALAPRPWFTWGLVVLNVAAWAATALAAGNGMHIDAATLLAWGGNSTHEVVARHDGWRLLSAAFLHGGLVHLGMNMLGLASVGPTLERLYGRPRFAGIYLGAALIGNALSLHFAASHAVSVGASGAVFGLFGALLVALHRQRKDTPHAFGTQNLGGVVFFIGYSLLQGLATPRIDNAAHVGGLLAGAALAWLLPRQLQAGNGRGLQARTGIAALLVVAAVAMLAARADPGVDQRQLHAGIASLQEGMRLFQVVQREIAADQLAVKEGRRTEAEMEARGRTVHAVNIRKLREQLERVQLPPGDPRAPFAADLLRVARLLEEMTAMESVVVDGKSVPVDPVRSAALEKEAREAAVSLGRRAEQMRRELSDR